MLEILSSYMPQILAAICILLAVCCGLLIAALRRTRHQEEESERVEEHLRSEMARQQQSQLAAAAENRRALEQRMDMLSTRLDVFDQSQDIRLHRIAATLDDKLSANDQRAEQLAPP